jgi:DNA polymerase sigma
MMRRDEELAHLAETRARLETARMTQEEVAAELEQRQQAEQSARVKLENARQAVKTLTFKSTEIETALARSRDELDRRYSSVQDIEKTLEQTAPSAEAALGEGNANDDNSDTAADSASLF